MIHPAQGAWYTGVYRNLFAEYGYPQDKIDAKVNGVFEQLFFGDSATQRLFRIVPGDTTMGFIDATDYVLTEGQSYGMMIAVQMDRKDIFDKLWKFAKTHMQQKSGDQQGYFAWKVANKAPFTPADVNPAPDGEEYFVTALYLADKRWTSVEGITAYQNYKQQADSILHYMLKSRSSLGPLVDPTRKQIVFSPAGSNPFSDPSYHLPAFYRLWAAFAGHNNVVWSAMADTSEAFFARCLKKSPYAINPDYATFDGDPAIFSAKVTDSGANAQRAYRYDTVYAADAHRTPMNIGMYWSWFQADTNAAWQTDKFLGFLRAQGGATLRYNQVYNLAGQPCAPNGWGPAESQVGANAAAVLASKDPANWAFVKAAFEVPTPDSSYRYYNGMVYMLGLLNAAGKFKAWGSPGLSGSISVKPGVGNAARLSVRLNGQNLQVSGVVGSVRLLDARGREAARMVADGSASFTLPHAGLWVVDAGAAGRRTVALP
jgi:endo-1,4-beta-D-glucanase Y